MELQGMSIIACRKQASGKIRFNGFNPTKGSSLLQDYTETTEGEIQEAVNAAHKDFTAFRKLSNRKRSELLNTIADEIMNLGDELIELCMVETALPKVRLTGERARTVNQLKMFAELVKEGSWIDARIDYAIPDREPAPKPDLRFIKIPLGPVAVFAVSNFPLAFSVAGGDTASAFAAGCPVVVKANPAHPGTSEMIATAIVRAIERHNLPRGIFSVVQGNSHDVGRKLVEHPFIKAVAFTGSFTGGKALFDIATRRPEPIPVYAEMGSTNPIFILPEALKSRGEKIASELCASINMGVGQFCTNPGISVLIKSPESDQFIEQLGENMSKNSSGALLTRNIKSSYDEGIQKLLNKSGVELVTSGQKTDGACQATSFLLKTDVKSMLYSQDLLNEVFGPSSILVEAGSKEEVLEFAKSLGGQLTASVFGDDRELMDYIDLVDILQYKVGRLIFNNYPTGVEVCASMNHGGPFPATTDARFTSVGSQAIERFVRPVCYQNMPKELLPDELKDENPLGIKRMIDGSGE